MNRSNGKREGKLAQPGWDRDEILAELEQILASPHFCNSKRYPALLRFIVDSTLDGKSDLLKERTLGVEIFGRSPNYDTNSDTIVRYTAGEVRKRLLLYYSEEGHSSRLRIALPAGSYVPEFGYAHEKLEGGVQSFESSLAAERTGPTVVSPFVEEGLIASAIGTADVPAIPVLSEASSSVLRGSRLGHLWWAIVGVAVACCGIAVGFWELRTNQLHDAVADFWAPVLRDQRTVLICTGGVVFSEDKYSGVTTANKDVEYPFVSLQIASSVARVSGLLERSGVSAQLIPSSSTPLTELRQHSMTLLGGYNNLWTIRLLQPLRYHFSPEPVHTIVDSTRPQFRLERDHTLPYSSADDFALVARYRDPVTGGWAVVLAGIGRNGTEAAALFATDSHYMKMLEDQVKGGFANRNVEAVLKVNVVDGKTGAPSLLAEYSW